jgi:hypothetical protein
MPKDRPAAGTEFFFKYITFKSSGHWQAFKFSRRPSGQRYPAHGISARCLMASTAFPSLSLPGRKIPARPGLGNQFLYSLGKRASVKSLASGGNQNQTEFFPLAWFKINLKNLEMQVI